MNTTSIQSSATPTRSKRRCNILGFVLGLAFFGGIWGMQARADFSWADNYTRSARADGWDGPIVSFSNVIDPARPWTITGSVANRMYFLDRKSLNQVAPNMRLSHWLHAERSDGTVTSSDEWRVYDCAAMRVSYLNPDEVSPSLNTAALKWFDLTPATPAAYRAAVCGR